MHGIPISCLNRTNIRNRRHTSIEGSNLPVFTFSTSFLSLLHVKMSPFIWISKIYRTTYSDSETLFQEFMKLKQKSSVGSMPFVQTSVTHEFSNSSLHQFTYCLAHQLSILHTSGQSRYRPMISLLALRPPSWRGHSCATPASVEASAVWLLTEPPQRVIG